MAVFQDNLNETTTVVELCGAVAGFSRQLQEKEHKDTELAPAGGRVARGAVGGFRTTAAPDVKVPRFSGWKLAGLYDV